jgi:hypothetical protein
MRKRKPKRHEIGIEGANKLMHDLGLPTPEEIAIMANVPVIDFELIEGTGNRCGCCHQPIKAREGIAFGRPGLIGGRVPPINVCANCIELARVYLASAKEGLI